MKNLIDIHTGEMNDSQDILGTMSILTVTHGTTLTSPCLAVAPGLLEISREHWSVNTLLPDLKHPPPQS